MHTLIYLWSLGLGPCKCQKVEGEGACSGVPAPTLAGQILPRVSIQFCFAASFSTNLSGFGPFFHFWGSCHESCHLCIATPFSLFWIPSVLSFHILLYLFRLQEIVEISPMLLIAPLNCVYSLFYSSTFILRCSWVRMDTVCVLRLFSWLGRSEAVCLSPVKSYSEYIESSELKTETSLWSINRYLDLWDILSSLGVI